MYKPHLDKLKPPAIESVSIKKTISNDILLKNA